MALEVQEMGLEAPEEHLVAQGMEQVQLTVAQVVAMAQVVATEERQALETAAMAAQERAMAAVVEMEALAMELGLEESQKRQK
jgi:broad specificity phosphatase PhoE